MQGTIAALIVDSPFADYETSTSCDLYEVRPCRAVPYRTVPFHAVIICTPVRRSAPSCSRWVFTLFTLIHTRAQVGPLLLPVDMFFVFPADMPDDYIGLFDAALTELSDSGVMVRYIDLYE